MHKMKVFLDNLERVNLASEDRGPKWHLVFPMGVVKHRGDFPGGRIEFSRDVLTAMAGNYAAEGKPERAVNYFHRGASSVPGTPEEKCAAGWISDVRVTDAGLETLIAWTERARGFIVADELRYLSPEFLLDGMSKATGKKQGPTLLGAALLNDPFLTELPRVAASENPNPNGEEMKNIATLLSLAEDATAESIEAAVKALTEKVAAHEAEKTAAAEATMKLTEESASKAVALTEVQAMVTKLTEQVNTLTKERADLAAKDAARDVKGYVDGLVKAGKVTPAIREGVEKLALAHGVDAVKFLEAATPVVQPNVEKGIVGDATAVDPKADAAKRFNAKRAEYEAKGMKFADAHNLTRGEMPTEFALAFAAK